MKLIKSSKPRVLNSLLMMSSALVTTNVLNQNITVANADANIQHDYNADMLNKVINDAKSVGSNVLATKTEVVHGTNKDDALRQVREKEYAQINDINTRLNAYNTEYKKYETKQAEINKVAGGLPVLYEGDGIKFVGKGGTPGNNYYNNYHLLVDNVKDSTILTDISVKSDCQLFRDSTGFTVTNLATDANGNKYDFHFEGAYGHDSDSIKLEGDYVGFYAEVDGDFWFVKHGDTSQTPVNVIFTSITGDCATDQHMVTTMGNLYHWVPDDIRQDMSFGNDGVDANGNRKWDMSGADYVAYTRAPHGTMLFLNKGTKFHFKYWSPWVALFGKASITDTAIAPKKIDVQPVKYVIEYPKPDVQTKINYVDDDDNGKLVKSDTLNGKATDTVNVNPAIPQNYHINGEYQKTYTFTEDKNPEITIHLKHNTHIVDHEKTVKDTIICKLHRFDNQIVDASKTITRTVVFKQKGYHDDVTGQDHWTEELKPQTFNEVTAPYIHGYTPKQSKLPAYTMTLNANDWDKNLDTTHEIMYEPNRESAMLYYVDQNGAPMETPEKITGLYGDHYKTSPETFEGYHLTQSPKNAEGVLDDTNADIVYRYAPDDASVNVVHKNLDMDDVSPSSKISGKVNTYYKTDKATPNGHHWTVMPWNAKGPFRAKNDDVKYIYDTDIEHIKVRYVDKNGKDLLPPDEVSGHYSTAYAAEAKKVWDYHLTDTPDNATGTFDVKNDEIKFVYEPDTEHVKVSYFDDWGNKLADDDDVTGDFGSDYKTTPKTFAQYQLINSSSNANGKFGRHNADVHYVYTKVETPSSASSNSSSASSASSTSSIASSQSSVISSASSVSSESSYMSSESSNVSDVSSTSSTSNIASSQSSAISSASSNSSESSYVSSSSAESSYVSSTSSYASIESGVNSSQSSNQISSSVSGVTSSQASSVSSNSSNNVSASVNTKWIDENGSELKQSEKGSHPDNDGKSDIKGYKIDSVEVDKNGNVINRYKKVDPETKLVSEPATIQKQNSDSQIKTTIDKVPNQKSTKQKIAKSKVEKTKAKYNGPKTLTQEHTKASQPTAENTSYAQPMTSSSVQSTDSESYSGKGRLPQTNTNEIGLSAAGMALLSSLGLTAVVRKRKKE